MVSSRGKNVQGTSRTHCGWGRLVAGGLLGRGGDVGTVGKGKWGQRVLRTHVEAFEDAVEFFTAPWFTLAEELRAQGIGPEGKMAEYQTVDEVVGGVAELFEGGHKSYGVLVRNRSGKGREGNGEGDGHMVPERGMPMMKTFMGRSCLTSSFSSSGGLHSTGIVILARRPRGLYRDGNTTEGYD